MAWNAFLFGIAAWRSKNADDLAVYITEKIYAVVYYEYNYWIYTAFWWFIC